MIPVIDVKNGLVVHATGGDRDRYRAIDTPLSASAQPVEVLTGLMSVHPFGAVYVADLDGIMTGVPDLRTPALIAERFPGLDLWIDNGAADAGRIEALLKLPRVTAVIGSETARSAEVAVALISRFGARVVLSLDFDGETFRGPEQLLAEPGLWPATIIAMTLASVGARRGPDVARIHSLAAAAPQARIVAAGGVRDKGDVVALHAAGAAAALVATALHSGTLKAGDLVEIAGLRAGTDRG